MRTRYWQAAAVATLGMSMIGWAILGGDGPGIILLVIATAAIPTSVLLAVSGRLNIDPPMPSVLGGATIGVAVAILSHAIVFGLAYALFLGFADSAVTLLESLRIDPKLTAAASSPWTILIFIELAVVAPFTEEIGKALGARLFQPHDRASAFLAGVAAGTGFAIVENILYAVGSSFFGTSWEPIVVGRMLGSAIHPLASGLVVLGWWEWRQHRNSARLAQRFLLGSGVHALWNGSLVVLGVVATSYEEFGFAEQGLTSLAYSAVFGAVAAAVLWRMSVVISQGGEIQAMFDAGDGRVIGAWLVLAASFLVPVVLMILAFPDFVAGF